MLDPFLKDTTEKTEVWGTASAMPWVHSRTPNNLGMVENSNPSPQEVKAGVSAVQSRS